MFYAGADGRAIEVVAGEMEAGKVRAEFFESGKTGDMAEIVLREGAGPDGNVRKHRLISNRKYRRDFAVDEADQFLG